MNVWHIPTNEEPPSVTMRNPLQPCEGDANVYVYCGGYPHGMIWSGYWKYRLQGEPDWEQIAFSWDSNPNQNEYFIAVLDNLAFSEGQTIEYYLAMSGNPDLYDDTYVYGDDTHSNKSANEADAQSSPYTYTLNGPRPTPSPSGTPGLTLLNVWHIPTNEEPTSATMRNPVYPNSNDDVVYIYCGAYPTGNTATGGSMMWKESGQASWNEVAFIFDSTQGNNDYWIALVNISSFGDGDTILYYLKMSGNPSVYMDTYVYGNDSETHTTGQEGTAQAGAYQFTIGNAPTPPPTSTPGGSGEKLNVWHIPINEEPAGVTMRKPLYPTDAFDDVDIYCGGYPQEVVWGGTLFWKASTSSSWLSAVFEWSSNENGNAYWRAELTNMPYSAGTTVEYYLAMTGDPGIYATTYVYGSDDVTNTTLDELTAQDAAFTYQVGFGGVTPTPTPGQRTPTPTPTAPVSSPTVNIPTPTPTDPGYLGMRLEMPSTVFIPGDPCYCTAYTVNPGSLISGVKVFVFLDIGTGDYYFWPSWTHFPPGFDYVETDIEQGTVPYQVLPEFDWPAGTGSASGIRFYAAMVNAAMTGIIGEMDIWEFEWRETD
ncbi:hypothetical protein JW979_15225 [bacterium]|nr:hypothetical protein [candidate division CSSED10-310 bacterium]